MATKTISIDLEAYARLKKVQHNGESFSQTIKRVVAEPPDYRKWLRRILKTPIDHQAAEAIEAVTRNRRGSNRRRR